MFYLHELKKSLTKDINASLVGVEAQVSRPLMRITEKSVEENDSIIETFRVTDSKVDREGDVILSSGGDIKVYKKFGSLLWGHRADLPDLVIGKPKKITQEDKYIDVTFEFTPPDINPTGAMVGRMVRGGFVQGSSVGIVIKKYAKAEDRGGYYPVDIFEWEMLEVSITPTFANPRATRQKPKDPDKAFEDGYTQEVKEAFQDLGSENYVKEVAATDPTVAAFIRAIGKNRRRSQNA